MKKNRDEGLFEFFKQEIGYLKQQAAQDTIDLCYFDEAGLNLNPHVPYAWQLKGTTCCLPAERGRGITILGIFNPRGGTVKGNLYKGAANSECVIQTLDSFSKTISKKTVMILDNVQRGTQPYISPMM